MSAGPVSHCYGFPFSAKENPVFPFHPFSRFAFQGTINLQLPVAPLLDYPRLDSLSNLQIR